MIIILKDVRNRWSNKHIILIRFDLFWRKSISNFDKGRFPYFRYFKKLDLQFQKFAPIYRLFQLKFIAKEATELRSEVASAAEL